MIPRRPANLHLQTPLNTPYLSTEDSVRNLRRMLNMETCEPTERREDCLGLEQGGKGKWVCAGNSNDSVSLPFSELYLLLYTPHEDWSRMDFGARARAR